MSLRKGAHAPLGHAAKDRDVDGACSYGGYM